MGKSKTKSKQTATVAPSTFSQPFINAAAAETRPAYEAAQAQIAQQMPRIEAVQNFNTDVMGGKYLGGNPYIDGMIAKSGEVITNGVNSQFSRAGRYGSGNHGGVLARALAENENQYRFQNYGQERAYQDQAGGRTMQGATLAAGLPQAASSTYADQIRGLLGQYNTQTGSSSQTSGQGFLGTLAGVAGAGLSGWASGGFK